jgi:hypothetical protein
LFQKKTVQPDTKPTETDIWSAARELHQQLKRGWDSAAKFGKIDLVEAGFDNFGNIYFVPAQILSIPVERFIAIDTVKLSVAHGVDEPYLTAYNKMLREYIAAKSWDKVSLLMDDFERRKTKFPQHETLLNLAVLFLFRHDENPYNYSPAMQMDKVNLAKKDPELRGFFLQMAWEVLVKEENASVWRPTNAPDFQHYLANQIPIREGSPNPIS